MKRAFDGSTSDAPGESVRRTNTSGRRHTFHASTSEVQDKRSPMPLCVPSRTPPVAVHQVPTPQNWHRACSHATLWACTWLDLAVSGALLVLEKLVMMAMPQVATKTMPTTSAESFRRLRLWFLVGHDLLRLRVILRPVMKYFGWQSAYVPESYANVISSGQHQNVDFSACLLRGRFETGSLEFLQLKFNVMCLVDDILCMTLPVERGVTTSGFLEARHNQGTRLHPLRDLPAYSSPLPRLCVRFEACNVKQRRKKAAGLDP